MTTDNSRYISKVTSEQRRLNALSPQWTAVELNYLMEKSETLFVSSLYNSYNEWAIKNGYPARTKAAILTQLTRHDKSRKPKTDPEEYSDIGLARVLHLEPAVLRRFRIANIPEIRMCGRFAIWSKPEIDTLCEWRPQVFCGRSYETVLHLLKDDYKAKFFASMPWCAIRDVPVRHVQTGKVYCSGNAASIDLNIPYHVINDMCAARNATSLKYPNNNFEYVFPPNKVLRSRTSNPSGKQVYRERSPN